MRIKTLKNIARFCAAASLAFVFSTSQADPVVDILVLYVDEAQNTNSGRDIDARISSYIEFSNRAFENSSVDMRLRLVGSEKVDVDYTYVTTENLGALRNNNQVARLRQQYGADLVTLLNLRQPMSGGYVCGIAYVPGGNASTGRLSSNAASVAFSLVGIDCGLNTFIHELGHNMSLGHSYMQNSGGGVWDWGRGHGVQGVFSTVMAYPHSYGTRNQLQRFSNPEQELCVDLPCGVDRNHTHGADASRNLNSLAQQVADFMPRIVEGPENPELQPCDKGSMEGNLIVNGEFDSLEGWTTLFNQSQLTQVEVKTDCIDYRLAVTNRTQYHSDAYQDLSDRLEVGRDYSFSAKFGVAGTERDTVRIALRIGEGNGVRYQYLDPISATSDDLTAYVEEFTLDATSQPDSVGVLLYGPQPGVSIIADELALVDVTVVDPEPEDRVVLHERFEREAQGWSSFGNSRTAFSTQAFEGDYSIRNYSRNYSYSGPIREMTGLIEAGISYEISTSVYVQDAGANSGNTSIWIYYVDDHGGNWDRVVNNDVATNSWQAVSGSFTISPVGNVTQVRLLVGGPRRSAELYVDDLLITQ